MNHYPSEQTLKTYQDRSRPEMDDLLDGLDEDQRAGVLADGGLTIISAGAGTGKTTTLTRRLVGLLRRGVRPEQIIAMTFTRHAAIEMRTRAEAIGGAAVNRVRFGTIHSVAAGIVRRHFQYVGLKNAKFTIIDESDRVGVVGDIMSARGMLNEFEDNPADKKKAIASADETIQSWKESGLLFPDSKSSTRPTLDALAEATVLVWGELHAKMLAENHIDFADLAPMATRILAGSETARQQEIGVIRAVLVDEWQDTNVAQLDFVRALTSSGASLTVVGDDDQSLYSFRNSIPRLMERTREYFPDLAESGLNLVSLTTNRRCTEQILAPANLIVDYNPRSEPKVLRSHRNGAPVGVMQYKSAIAEADGIAKRVMALVNGGCDPSQIAVLVRAHYVANEIGNAFVKYGINHQMQAGLSFIERASVKDVMAYVKLAVNPSSELAFARIASRPIRGLGATAAQKIIEHSRYSGGPIYESLAHLAAKGVLKGSAASGASTLARQLSYMHDAVQAEEDANALVEYILYDVGYKEWAETKDETSRALTETMRTLLDIAGNYPAVIDFLDVIMVSERSEQRAGDGVHVGTIHGSKGLEWDHVFLPGFEEDVFPNSKSKYSSESADGFATDEAARWRTRSGGSLEEERRLAHVAMTRARTSIDISCARMRTLFGKPQFHKPSQFFNEAELRVPALKDGGPARKNTGWPRSHKATYTGVTFGARARLPSRSL